MATAFEELKLSVNLTDVNTSAGFQRLRTAIAGVKNDLSALNEATKKVDFKKVTAQTEQVGTIVKGISKQISGALTRVPYLGPMLRGLEPQITSLVNVLIPFGLRIPIFIVAVAAAIGAAVKALGDHLNSFAHSALELDSIAKEIGLSVGKLKGLRDQLSLTMGKAGATKAIHDFYVKVQGMRRGTDAFYDLARAAGPTARNAQLFQEKILALLDQRKPAAALNAVKAEALKQQEQYKRMGFSEYESSRMLNAFLARFGQTQELLHAADAVERTPEQEAKDEMVAEKSREFALIWNKLAIQIGEVWDAVKVAFLPAMNRLAEWMNQHPNWGTEFVESIFKAADKLVEYAKVLKPILDFLTSQAPEDAPPEGPLSGVSNFLNEGIDQWRRGLTEGHWPWQPENSPSGYYGGGAQFFSGSGGAGGGDIGANTTELKRLNDNLYELLNLRRDENGNVSIGGGAAAGAGADSGSSSSSSSSSSQQSSNSANTTPPGSPPITGPGSGTLPDAKPPGPMSESPASGVIGAEPGFSPNPMDPRSDPAPASAPASGSGGSGVLPSSGDAGTGGGATSGGSSNAVDAMTGGPSGGSTAGGATVPLQAFRKGGVVKKTTLALLGESGEEAVVPLHTGITGDTMRNVGETRTGRGSLFGNYQGRYPWVDTGDVDAQGRPLPTYSGTPLNVPGIGLPSQYTAGRPGKQEGQWFAVTGPDGKVYYAQQTDIGPSASTGRTVDINAPLAERMGYVPDAIKGGKHFPTDADFTVRRVDPEEALWMGQPFERGAIDAASGAETTTLAGSGAIKVKVESGRATRMDPPTNQFRPIDTNRQTTMPPANSGPASPSTNVPVVGQ